MSEPKRTGNAPEGTRFHLRFDEEETAMIELLATDRGVSYTALFRLFVREAYERARAKMAKSSTYGKAAPAVAVAAESERELEPATESEQHLRWPHCMCVTPTPWASRKVDGRWTMSADEPELEQRTCLACGSSQSREIGR